MQRPVTILVNDHLNPVLGDNLFEKPQIARGAFKGKETGSQQFPRRIIDGGHQATRRMLWTQPGMGTSVPKNPPPFLSLPLPSLAMLGTPTPALGCPPCSPPHLPHRLSL